MVAMRLVAGAGPFRFLSTASTSYRWVILAVASLGVFTSGPGQTYTFSVFIDPMIEELGWARSHFTAMYAAGSLTGAVLIILVGRLLDRYGTRRVLAGVVVLFGLAAIWMSSVDTTRDLYLGVAAMRTLGQGAMTMAPTTLVALWFVRNRGRATSIATMGGAVSATVFPIIGHALISQFGWRDAWIGLALVIWGLMLLPALLLVRRSPESVGQRPDGVKADGPSLHQPAPLTAADGFTLREAMSCRAFWFLLVAGASFSLIGTALTFHNISLMDGKGIDGVAAAGVLSVMAISSFGSNLLAGVLNDRYPNRYVLAAAQALLIAAMLFSFLVTGTALAIVYGVLLGAGMGIGMNTITVIWPNYFGRRHIGSIRGLAMTSTMAFAALGPHPFSLLYESSGSYNLAIAVFLALPVACAVLGIASPRPSRRAGASGAAHAPTG